MSIKSELIIVLLIATSGCVTTQAYKNKIDTFVGGNIDKVVAKLGLPDNQLQTQNGNNVYVYSALEQSSSPETCATNSNGVYNCTGGGTSTEWCKTFYEIDKNNIVTNTSFRGNNCKACAPNDKTCQFLQNPFSWLN